MRLRVSQKGDVFIHEFRKRAAGAPELTRLGSEISELKDLGWKAFAGAKAIKSIEGREHWSVPPFDDLVQRTSEAIRPALERCPLLESADCR